MSLAIDMNRITHVLLADGWHTVGVWKDGRSSFVLDAYEYIDDAVFGGGQSELVCSTGFEFEEYVGAPTPTGNKVTLVSGPLTAILAVRQRARTK